MGNPNSQERQNAAVQAVGAAPVVGDSKEGAAIVNNVDDNGNGADVADLPVHRGVKEDPANAIENPQVVANNQENNGENADEGVALADNDDADNGGAL